MRIEYMKLVRDRIPEIIRDTGKSYSASRLNEESYIAALAGKLVEEAMECEKAVADESDVDIVKELADLSEVLESLMAVLGIEDETVRTIQAQRRTDRGSFSERILLEWVEE